MILSRNLRSMMHKAGSTRQIANVHLLRDHPKDTIDSLIVIPALLVPRGTMGLLRDSVSGLPSVSDVRLGADLELVVSVLGDDAALSSLTAALQHIFTGWLYAYSIQFKHDLITVVTVAPMSVLLELSTVVIPEYILPTKATTTKYDITGLLRYACWLSDPTSVSDYGTVAILRGAQPTITLPEALSFGFSRTDLVEFAQFARRVELYNYDQTKLYANRKSTVASLNTGGLWVPLGTHQSP